MAKTAEQNIRLKGEGVNRAFPVASGETIYKGTIAVVSTATGLLQDADATIIAAGTNMAVLVKDGSANTTPAATTAAGSISGDLEVGAAVAGDKTVRDCYVEGLFKFTTTGAAQTLVGKPIYTSDNYTFSNTSSTGVWIGTCAAYISSTEIYVDLNKSYAI